MHHTFKFLITSPEIFIDLKKTKQNSRPWVFLNTRNWHGTLVGINLGCQVNVLAYTKFKYAFLKHLTNYVCGL
jgi:hypothetical protein